MAEKYVIKYVVDDSQARQAYARGTKDMAALEAQALKTADALQRMAVMPVRAHANGQAQITAAVIMSDEKTGRIRRER